jgi:hypothetical protein
LSPIIAREAHPRDQLSRFKLVNYGQVGCIWFSLNNKHLTISSTDVYQAADAHNVTVVGGAALSVGAAGGWAMGGGHSPLSHKYGLGVDSAFRSLVSSCETCLSPQQMLYSIRLSQPTEIF